MLIYSATNTYHLLIQIVDAKFCTLWYSYFVNIILPLFYSIEKMSWLLFWKSLCSYMQYTYLGTKELQVGFWIHLHAYHTRAAIIVAVRNQVVDFGWEVGQEFPVANCEVFHGRDQAIVIGIIFCCNSINIILSLR